jgi:hypothetical protein
MQQRRVQWILAKSLAQNKVVQPLKDEENDTTVFWVPAIEL